MRDDHKANFDKWFGDSQVVGADGTPLVVYHGTVKDFSLFGGKNIRQGFHFGTPEQAEFRLHRQHALSMINQPWSEGGHNVIPVYLSIKNPKRLRDRVGSWTPAVQRAMVQGHDGIVYLNRGECPAIPGQPLNKLTGREINALNDEQYVVHFPSARDSWVAFRPEQIKSATGNNGLFAVDNPDITDRKAAAEQALDFLSGLKKKVAPHA